MPYVFVALTCVFAGAYASIRRSATLPSRLFFKTAASVMLILVVVSARTGAGEPYYTLVLIGLCFSLASDVLLVFTHLSRSYLIAGMIGLICTYLLYIGAFWTAAAPAWYDAAFFLLLIAVGAFALKLRSVKPGRLGPVVFVYAAVLCAMAARAFSMLLAPEAGAAFAVCAAVGGVLLALADMLLAFEKFSNSFGRASGILSAAAYYSGQALIALTVML